MISVTDAVLAASLAMTAYSALITMAVYGLWWGRSRTALAEMRMGGLPRAVFYVAFIVFVMTCLYLPRRLLPSSMATDVYNSAAFELAAIVVQWLLAGSVLLELSAYARASGTRVCFACHVTQLLLVGVMVFAGLLYLKG